MTRLLVTASVTALTACAQSSTPAETLSPPATAAVDTVVVVDTVRVEVPASTADLEQRIARLQIQILERDVQLGELEEQLASTRLELVRNMARLQTQASRAEAASGMAEAEIALGTLRRAPGAEALPELDDAQALFGQSSSEFATENYGGALYLATQVRTLVRNGQARLRSSGVDELVTGESVFALPVPLRTTGRSNVRSGPGLGFDVQFTLDASAAVVGQSYTSQWVRVVDEGGREGWIFHTLVTGR